MILKIIGEQKLPHTQTTKRLLAQIEVDWSNFAVQIALKNTDDIRIIEHYQTALWFKRMWEKQAI